MSWGETLFLKKVIDGRKRFVASDATIAIAYDGEYHNFTPKIDGVIRVSATTYNTNKDYSGEFILILRNITDGTEQRSTEFGNAKRETKTHYFDFSIKKGKTYQVKIDDATMYDNFDLIRAEYKGQIVDNNYFSIGGDE